jgi:hypothetical protein
MSYMFCGCLSLVNIKDIKNIEINNQMWRLYLLDVHH